MSLHISSRFWLLDKQAVRAFILMSINSFGSSKWRVAFLVYMIGLFCTDLSGWEYMSFLRESSCIFPIFKVTALSLLTVAGILSL
jgi:hypothetical protein